MARGLRNAIVAVAVVGGILIFAGWWLLAGSTRPGESSVEVAARPKISPDYSDTVLPVNIAPVDFYILERGERYFVRVHAERGGAIDLPSRTGQVRIPAAPWRALLEANRGGTVLFDVYVKDGAHAWRKFRSISNAVAEEDIDGYVVYRRMKPIYNWWKDIGIHQRNLAGYGESPILRGRSFEDGCLNCHSFVGNDPNVMTIGLRSAAYGSSTLLVRDGVASKIGAKWGYTTWHPSGKLAVYSINKVRQFFHAGRMEIRDVVDLDSALVCYIAERHTVVCPPQLADKDRLETYPAWSPDGEYLYFCSAPILWKDRTVVPPENYDKVKYDLRRVHYDARTDQWGQVEIVLAAQQTGLSILLPRVSPDGQFLLFCMCEYGCFPIYQPSSDLYLMDLTTGKYERLGINSGYSESWHSWSSNSRWIAFSSKRQGGLFTRIYLSYVDHLGHAHKPFVLPQRDPTYDESLLETYSVPELAKSRVDVGRAVLARASRAEASFAGDVPLTGATTKAPKIDLSQERE